MRVLGFVSAIGVVMAMSVLSGCGPKPEVLDFTQQTPSGYITAERSAADEAVFSDQSCSRDMGRAGSAMDYLQALVARGWRHTGSQEMRCAAAYIRESFKAMGYQVSEQVYPFPYYQFDLKNAYILRVRDNKKYEAMPIIYSARMDTPITAKVVKPGKDLKGRIVYADIWDWAAPFQKRMREWQAAGAIGVLFSEMILMSGEMSAVPPFGINSMMPIWPTWRYTLLPGVSSPLAKELIGETVTIFNDGRIVKGQGYNVIAWSGKETDSYVLVTGHPDSWFEGAWDDGTGTAAMMEVARLMKDDPDGIIFLGVDGEEPGLIGSAAYIQKFGSDKIKAVIEFDGASVLKKNGKPSRHTTGPSDGLAGFTKKNLKGFTSGNVLLPMRLYRKLSPIISTDSFWFEARGVPAVWFANPPNSFYHSRKDTIDRIPAADLEEVAENGVALARAFREARSLPRPFTILNLDFQIKPEGDTIVFKAAVPDAGPKAKVSVICLYLMGVEKEVVLAKRPDGSFQGSFKPNLAGEWQFLAIAQDGSKFAKQWLVFNK